MAFSSTMTRIAIVSWGSPTRPEISAAASSTRIMAGTRNLAKKGSTLREVRSRAARNFLICLKVRNYSGVGMVGTSTASAA